MSSFKWLDSPWSAEVPVWPPATMRPFERFGPPDGPLEEDVPLPENGDAGA